MDFSTLFATSNLTLVAIVQYVWGLAVKRWPLLAPVPNRLIPAMNILVGWLTALAAPAASKAVAALIGLPTDAYASEPGGGVAAVVTHPLFTSWLGMALTTSHHSLLKNTWQWFKETILSR